MTTILQKLGEKLEALASDFRMLRRDVDYAIKWITTHDEKERAAIEARNAEAADNRKWFWRAIGGTIIVAMTSTILNGIGGLIVIIVSLLLNDKFTAIVHQLTYVIRLQR